MNTIFRKALTVLGSAALVGSTVGGALAANYPAPFDKGNVAIVVGSEAALADNTAALSISSDLSSAIAAMTTTSGPTTVTGGDSYKVEKESTKFNLGDTITGVVSATIDDEEMPVLLAEGTYTDDNNDEFDFEQTITLSAAQLTMFEDADYKKAEPTIGMKIANDADVLAYTLTFTEQPVIEDIETTDLTIMGREYYVLEASDTEFTLLDSAASDTVAEGQTVTVQAGGKTYTVSIQFVDDTDTKLTINGQTTNKLAEGETQRLTDGSYVGVKEVLYSAKETGVSKVEFSIGTGKLVLGDGGATVELNEENVDGLTSTILNDTTELTSITLDWDADEDLFITEDQSVSMPGFGNVQVAFGGLNIPSEEKIMLENDGDDSIVLTDFPLKDSTADIHLAYSDGTSFVGIGEDSDTLLKTNRTGGSVTLNLTDDDVFVVSYVSGDDAESYFARVTNFDSTDDEVDFEYLVDGTWTSKATNKGSADSVTFGNVEMTVSAIDGGDGWVKIQNGSASTNFNQLYSKEGLKVLLPYDHLTDAASTGAINLTNATFVAYTVRFTEEDEDDAIGAGDALTATASHNSDGDVHISAYTGGEATEEEVGTTDLFVNYVYSPLATKIEHDKSGDQETLTLTYHGSEVTADVYITSSDAVVGAGSSAGAVTVLDTEVATKAAGMDLIVVGGSAINSVAAELLGGAYREAEFTSKTGIGAGQFLIESFARNGKTALLVAGYHAADTTLAATYLTNNGEKVDTTVGKKYTGSSATEANLVVA